MGLIVSVYRDSGSRMDCTNGGVSGRVTSLTVVNVEGPFEPTDDRPAVMIIDGPRAGSAPNPILVNAVKVAGVWMPDRPNGMIGPMFGGNYGATSDSRFSRAAGGRRPLPIHDRFETPAEYEALSR